VINQLKQILKNHACPLQAISLARFFKTGPGEYAQGDKFYGINVPTLRMIAKQFQMLSKPDLEQLLHSPVHEERFISLVILINQYQKTKNIDVQAEYYRFYSTHMQCVNNWDLVDLSAPKIVGDFLFYRDRNDLYQWIQDPNMWIRRIAIVATLTFIRKGDIELTLSLSKRLLEDKEDLIHKAVGWMLREVGKKDVQQLQDFLKQYYHQLPRTTLRYAIERFHEDLRKDFLVGNF
jgi:3-methyladenine DNA glycosylase AlkD